MFAPEILPHEAYLPIGNLLNLRSALLLAKHEVVAPVRKRCMEPERDAESWATLNDPVGGLVFQTGQRSGATIECHQHPGILQNHVGGEGGWCTRERRQEH